MLTTRFAPSPTGYLHLGHVLSAWWSQAVALATDGHYRLRLEDLDDVRSSPIYEAAILEDLEWLGITHSGEVVRQSHRAHFYKSALHTLKDNNLIYPCFCSRKDIATQSKSLGWKRSSGGHHYPGTCRNLSTAEQMAKFESGIEWRWRFNIEAAQNHMLQSDALYWQDIWGQKHPVICSELSDIALTSRGVRNQTASYHLAVVVDDAQQGVNCVTRGDDLRFATPTHRLLQHSLGYPVPLWAHHPLIFEPDSDNKLSKRQRPESIRDLKSRGLTAKEVLEAAKSAVTLPPIPDLIGS